MLAIFLLNWWDHILKQATIDASVMINCGTAFVSIKYRNLSENISSNAWSQSFTVTMAVRITTIRASTFMCEQFGLSNNLFY